MKKYTHLYWSHSAIVSIAENRYSSIYYSETAKKVTVLTEKIITIRKYLGDDIPSSFPSNFRGHGAVLGQKKRWEYILKLFCSWDVYLVHPKISSRRPALYFQRFVKTSYNLSVSLSHSKHHVNKEHLTFCYILVSFIRYLWHLNC